MRSRKPRPSETSSVISREVKEASKEDWKNALEAVRDTSAELDRKKLQVKKAEQKLEDARERAATVYEKAHILETLTAKNGAVWYLVDGTSKDFRHELYYKVSEESYLTNLKGTRIRRKHSYEGYRVGNPDAWGVCAYYCDGRQSAIDCAEEL